MSKVNYRVIEDDAWYPTIMKTQDPADGCMVFKTIKEAKQYILDDAKYKIDHWKHIAKRTREMTTSSIETEEA